jgi:hypothetical protein
MQTGDQRPQSVRSNLVIVEPTENSCARKVLAHCKHRPIECAGVQDVAPTVQSRKLARVDANLGDGSRVPAVTLRRALIV